MLPALIRYSKYLSLSNHFTKAKKRNLSQVKRTPKRLTGQTPKKGAQKLILRIRLTGVHAFLRETKEANHLTRREGKCWTCPPSQKKVNFSYRKRKITFFNRRSLTSCSCFLRPGKISFLMRKRNWVEKLLIQLRQLIYRT